MTARVRLVQSSKSQLWFGLVLKLQMTSARVGLVRSSRSQLWFDLVLKLQMTVRVWFGTITSPDLSWGLFDTQITDDSQCLVWYKASPPPDLRRIWFGTQTTSIGLVLSLLQGQPGFG